MSVSERKLNEYQQGGRETGARPLLMGCKTGQPRSKTAGQFVEIKRQVAVQPSNSIPRRASNRTETRFVPQKCVQVRHTSVTPERRESPGHTLSLQARPRGRPPVGWVSSGAT